MAALTERIVRRMQELGASGAGFPAGLGEWAEDEIRQGLGALDRDADRDELVKSCQLLSIVAGAFDALAGHTTIEGERHC